jgi:pimeloyl-ACP methyl ester carboxylesterase
MIPVKPVYDGRTRIAEGGTIPATAVLLPGNMCDTRLWTDEVRAVLPNAVDADLTLDHSIAAMAARTLAATEGPLLPIGFSMGGIVAVEMAVQAPDRIVGMALIGYNATADLPERAAHRPTQQAEVRAGGLERVLVEELKPNYVAEHNRSNLKLLALLLDMGMTVGPEVFVRQSEALRLREDRVTALRGIDCPVMLMCGTEDALCPPELHSRWQSLLPDAWLFTAGTGHMLPLEAPSFLVESLETWLATLIED